MANGAVVILHPLRGELGGCWLGICVSVGTKPWGGLDSGNLFVAVTEVQEGFAVPTND